MSEYCNNPGPPYTPPVNRHWKGAIYPHPVALFKRGERVIRLSVWASKDHGLDHGRMLRIAAQLRPLIMGTVTIPCEYLGIEGGELAHVELARKTRNKKRLTACPNCGHNLT